MVYLSNVWGMVAERAMPFVLSRKGDSRMPDIKLRYYLLFSQPNAREVMREAGRRWVREIIDDVPVDTGWMKRHTGYQITRQSYRWKLECGTVATHYATYQKPFVRIATRAFRNITNDLDKLRVRQIRRNRRRGQFRRRQRERRERRYANTNT